MAYTGLTRLRISTGDGSIQMGSGEVVSARASEGSSSAGGFTAEDLQGVTPYNSYSDFLADAASAPYKVNVFDPRPSEVFREQCARRLAAMEYRDAARAEHTASQMSPAEQIVALNEGRIPLEIAQLAVQQGSYINMEHQVQGGKETAAQNSQNAQDLHEARITLSMLEGR